MNTQTSVIKKSDKWIPWYFVIFFAVIAVVNAIFVTTAITTQTGVVTDGAYEKGLAYDRFLDAAAAQARLDVEQHAEFKDGVLSWKITTREGRSLNASKVTVHFYRPAEAGHDFNARLHAAGNGLYQEKPQFPLPGLWVAQLEAQWQGPQSKPQTYKTNLELQAP
jgi:nitrogen fixation protein FixH